MPKKSAFVRFCARLWYNSGYYEIHDTRKKGEPNVATAYTKVVADLIVDALNAASEKIE